MSMRAGLTAGLAASTMAVVLAVPASADGLHIFQNNPQFVWHKGCAVKYSLSDDMPAPYATAIQEGLAAITAQMSMTLTLVPTSDTSPAVIRYSINPNLPPHVAGLGSTGGTVELTPLEKLPDWQDDQRNADIRKNLIAHESLHVFGLTHDLDETDPNGPDEIMYPILPITPLHFGNGDLTGMAFIKEQNRCGTANPVATPPDLGPSVQAGVEAFLSSPRWKRTAKGVRFTWRKRNETGVAGQIVIKVSATRDDKTVGSCSSTGTSCTIRLPRGRVYFGSMGAYLRTDAGLVLVGMPNMFVIGP
jgi:hypothetical protein